MRVLTYVATVATALATSWYDEITVEIIDGVEYEFGWTKVMECTEGVVSGSSNGWRNPSTSLLAATADSVKIVPAGGVDNPRYSDFALIAKPGSSVVDALRDGFELSYQYDADATPNIVGWADTGSWEGSSAAMLRIPDGCGPADMMVRPFSSVIYAAHCNGGGLHMYGDFETYGMCLWEWNNHETGEDIEVYVGNIISNTTIVRGRCEDGLANEASVCEQGLNYAFDGIPCLIAGDPHTTTWSGVRHDFQGAGNGQHYYLSQCEGSTLTDMPYSFIGQHTPWVSIMRGLDHFTIALYGEIDYYIFISASLHSFVEVAQATGGDYDDNAANSNLISMDSGADIQIGNFTFRYTQTSDSLIDAVLTMADGCTVDFYMEGQAWSPGYNRWMMHAALIQPPSCHRCHTCGLCGNFKNTGSVLETCYGSTIEFEAGFDATNAFAFDADGNTWEKAYRDTHCPVSDCIEVTEEPKGLPEVFVPAFADDFVWEDPCDEAIIDEVANQCEEAMDEASECCDAIGGSVCEDLLEDCKFDACVAAEGDADAIADEVTALFSDAVNMVCDIPDIGEEFDDEHLVVIGDYPTQEPTTSAPTTAQPTTVQTTAAPNAEPTGAPTTSEPTTSSPTTVSPTTSSPTTAEPSSPTTDTAAETTSADTPEPLSICYSDEECRGSQICDVYFFCVDPLPGCCYDGESYTANEKCLRADDQAGCDRNGCLWMTTDDPNDCAITSTETPTTTAEAGCCKGTSYMSNADCNLGLDEKSCGRKCEWVSGGVLEEDCAVTTTTSSPTTTEVGCCKGDSTKATDKCNALSSSKDCDRMSSCNWVEDGITERDCTAPSTTTDPGCCYGNPAAAYSSRWMEKCKTFFTQNECLMLTDDLSLARCFWEPLGAYEDCEQTWPTTTSVPTTTSAPSGCCYGDSYKANTKCTMAMEQSKCESKGCAWKVTEDPKDCEITTTETPTTTAEEGCCKGGSYQSNAECNLGLDEKSCGRKCEWISGGVLEEDCAMTTTTTSTPTTTETEVGCCKGTSYLSNGECNLGATEKECGRKCEWITGGVVEVDCAITTTSTPLTTTSTPEVGCCKGTSFMSNPDCNEMASSHSCGRKCEWVVDGVVEVDCAMETPSPTEPETGCCKGETYTSNLACNEKDVEESCSRSGKCEWIKNGDVEVECFMDATTPSPEEPTTTAPAGCCYGESYKANDKCLKSTVEHMCTQNGCEWMVTEDPEDCVITTTTSTPTTTESGCCAGTSASSTEMCNEKVGRESCERSGKCAFRAGEEDCAWPTTTSEPWLGAKDASNYDLPVNPYKRRGNNHKQESVLSAFGGEGVVSETMQSTVSLSTLMVLVVAAFAAFQLFKWWSASKAYGYTKLVDVAPTAVENRFQTV